MTRHTSSLQYPTKECTLQCKASHGPMCGVLCENGKFFFWVASHPAQLLLFHFLPHLCKISIMGLDTVVMRCRVGYLPSRSTEETGKTSHSLPGFLRSLSECICLSLWRLTVVGLHQTSSWSSMSASASTPWLTSCKEAGILSSPGQTDCTSTRY